MEKTDKPLTRDALVSMQVIDAKGRLVGKVKDIAFAVGKTGIALSVENEAGEIQHIPWEDVQAASDFILLKPVPQSTSQQAASNNPFKLVLSLRKKRFLGLMKRRQQQPSKLMFSSSQLNHFAQHAINLSHGFHNIKDGTATTKKNTFQWMKKFLGLMNSSRQRPKQSTQRLCPTCNQPLTWIPQYKRWYCYNEKKYV